MHGRANAGNMRIFADTHYFIALLSRRDGAHEAALRWRHTHPRHEIVTTSWVLLELAGSMSMPHERVIAARFIENFKASAWTKVIPLSENTLWKGFELYRSRTDKKWSLTDSISFVVMAEEGLTEALTGDRHFEQAGFTALLT